VPSGPADSPEPNHRRILLVAGGVLLLGVASLVCAVTVPVWARWMAVRQMEAGAISEAQRWLRWSAWFAFGGGETELVRIACFRRLGQISRWEAALQSAQEKGADPDRVQQERILGLIRQGAHEVPEDFWRSPVGVGLRLYDGIEACVRGHLARNEPAQAREILEFWTASLPQEAYIAYLQGVYWFNQADEAQALAEFEKAIARQAGYELAHIAVARLYEKQDRVAESLAAYARFASSCPHSNAAVVGLARALRKLTRIEEARAVVGSLRSSSDPFSGFQAEMGAIELELGNYQEALRWLGQAPAPEGQKKQELLWDAALAFGLQEEATVADRLFEQADGEMANLSRISELLTQLAVAPDRKEAADELHRLSETVAATALQPTQIELERAGLARRESAGLTAADLYALHCDACHGPQGGGDGRAARHQFPVPRDLRGDSSRLVSTQNGIPTIQDLAKVIKQGMPGTSMRAFDQLSEDQLQRLAEEVRRMRREGLRDSYVAMLQAEDEEIEEADVQAVVDLRSLPGDTVQVPAIGPADEAAAVRGRTVYFDSGCRPCHADDGTGVPDTVLFDPLGLPVPSRNLVHDPFKGGHDPESVGLRILAGMPGSPHPATKVLTPQQCIDLVHFCSSLSRQPKRTLTNHQRYLEATRCPLPAEIRED